MSSTFTPSQAVDMSREKDWPMNIGMLDWDNTKIVFTKRSLVEFLKYTGITVDPGFMNIQKLPRYAEFGKMEKTTVEGTTSSASAGHAPAHSTAHRLLGEEFPDDALSTAPPVATATNANDDTSVSNDTEQLAELPPSRRIRTTVGGKSSIGSIFSDEGTGQFVPTRRVRQRPGGQDNIEGLF